ncbi:MAG: type II toxin-antitoxin system HicB family antitoxin [Patescibacteria group bacterium]
MNKKFTAVYKKSGKWYLGWVEEVPGVNTQGKTLSETRANLSEALSLVLETNQLLTRKNMPRGRAIRESISIA